MYQKEITEMERIKTKKIMLRNELPKSGECFLFPTVLMIFILFMGLVMGFVTEARKPGGPDIAKMVASTMALENELQASSLLLGSGLTNCRTAKIRYSLWMENNGDITGLSEALESADANLSWRADVLVNGWGKRAVCLWAEENVDSVLESEAPGKLRQFEQILNQWYSGVCKPARRSDTRLADTRLADTRLAGIWLEEWIDDAISLQDYWCQENISLQQCSNDGVVESWCGLAPKGLNPAKAGDSLINVQLTVRKTSEGGKTVLAFPALYNDI